MGKRVDGFPKEQGEEPDPEAMRLFRARLSAAMVAHLQRMKPKRGRWAGRLPDWRAASTGGAIRTRTGVLYR